MSKEADSGWLGFGTLNDLYSECAVVQRIFCLKRVRDPLWGEMEHVKITGEEEEMTRETAFSCRVVS